jgi:polar amino acid transport system substrate-binding protein
MGEEVSGSHVLAEKKHQPKPKRRKYGWWIGTLAGVLGLIVFLMTVQPKSGNRPLGDTLRWGGDAGGGAPFIIEEAKDGKPGFEVELAQYLAGKLGVRDQLVHKEWDMLPQDLKRGDIDIILNGYEWSLDRQREMLSTVPYYIFRLQLITRRDDRSIRGWDDLRAKPGKRKKRVGVLNASGGHRYVEEKYGNDVEIEALGEEGTTGVLAKVQSGSLDASVQDTPTATYYVGSGREFPSLKLTGEPVDPGYFVIYLRRTDNELCGRLNDTLRAAQRDGTLRRIYSKYGLWNEDQERLPAIAADWPPKLTDSDTSLLTYGWLLTRAAGTTVLLACLSMPLAMLAGLLIAVGRLYGPRWLDWLLGAYVELLRGTPLLLQLSVIYYLLPNVVGIKLPAFWAGLLGLAINYSAYEAENYRAGLLAIPRGQMEAALSLGMTTWTALRRVIIPQAVRIVIPPVTNDFIALFKDTSVCSVIAVSELTLRYRYLMVNHSQLVIELGLMTALLYLLMSYPLSLVARRLEKRFPRVVV